MKSFFFIFILLSPLQGFSAKESSEAVGDSPDIKVLRFDAKEDLIDSLEWAWKGSYKQFHGTQNKVFATLALLSTTYFIFNDKRISKKIAKQNKDEKIFRLISDVSIFFNTPILPMSFYIWGRQRSDDKMVRFSKEYLATLTLALLETAAISMVPVHQRPDQKELSFWEKAFRGQSSFPSGHVVGFTVLGMKSLQFYGPQYAIAPFILAAATGWERVRGEKHFASDIVASGFISLLASEGVRYASDYDQNHPIYDWIFKHDFSLNYIRRNEAPGMSVSFSY